MDVEAIKQRTAETWGLGDYSVLSAQLAPAARVLADACAVSAGQEVLDVGAGDGNFALACAHEGASVVASDLSPGMVERGRARSEAEGYEIEWVEADAEDLPFDDGRFDCAGSNFGAFIAPRPEVAAAELFRVVRPGGTVGLTAWTPEGLMGDLFRIGRAFAPPDPDLPASVQWGDEATARERMEPLAGHVEVERRAVAWTGDSAEGFAEQLLDSAPPMIAARRALPPERFEELRGQLVELMGRRNAAADGGFSVDAEYAVIVARKRG